MVLAKWDKVLAGTANGYYDGVSIDTSHTSSGYSMTDPSRTGVFCGIQGIGAVSGPDRSRVSAVRRSQLGQRLLERAHGQHRSHQGQPAPARRAGNRGARVGHSVFQHTPGGFDGYEETYALNEASGDIFGALTEHYANHADDKPDYLFAEEANALGRAPSG